MKAGRAVSLISSGIDSPVATHVMQKKCLDIIAVHFSDNPDENAKPRQKCIEMCRHLGVKRLYIVKHIFLMDADIRGRCDPKSRCVMCKRMMLRTAQAIAEKEGASCIITGENLGQVASQTLDNMFCTDSSVSMPILRPLLCNDKQEIVDIAKNIGTYDLSVEAAACCTAVPKQPLTRAVLHRIEAEERKIDIGKIVGESLERAEVFDF